MALGTPPRQRPSPHSSLLSGRGLFWQPGVGDNHSWLRFHERQSTKGRETLSCGRTSPAAVERDCMSRSRQFFLLCGVLVQHAVQHDTSPTSKPGQVARQQPGETQEACLANLIHLPLRDRLPTIFAADETDLERRHPTSPQDRQQGAPRRGTKGFLGGGCIRAGLRLNKNCNTTPS